MHAILFLIASMVVLAAFGAVLLRNLVHCALCLALTFAGLAALYLRLGAQFVGFAQILVYIGAVSILIVFALLLTRGSGIGQERALSGSWLVGLSVSLLVAGALASAILTSTSLRIGPAVPRPVLVRKIGTELMSNYVLPLETAGLVLTVALIGAVIVAMPERKGPRA